MNEIYELREAIRQIMNQILEGELSSNWDKQWEDLKHTFEAMGKTLRSETLNQAQIEGISSEARNCLTSEDIKQLVDKFSKDATSIVQPMIISAISQIGEIIIEGTMIAIREFIRKKLNEMGVI